MKTFLFVFMVLSTIISYAQEIEGVFLGVDNEGNKIQAFLSEDSIGFVFANHDGFESYSLFLGTYSLRKGKLRLGDNKIANYTSKIDCNLDAANVGENIKITFLNADLYPIQYARVKVSLGSRKVIEKSTDENGTVFLLQNELNSFDDKIIVSLHSLGYNTKQSIEPILGSFCKIVSRIPVKVNFTELNANRVHLKKASNNTIYFSMTGIEGRSTLSKDKKCIIISDCLLETLQTF